MNPRRAQHQPSGRCAPVHCHWHNIDEGRFNQTVRMICFECGHRYRTAGSIRRAYRRAYAGLIWKDLRRPPARIEFLDHQPPPDPEPGGGYLIPDHRSVIIRPPRSRWWWVWQLHRLVTVRATQIYFCQYCTHDF